MDVLSILKWLLLVGVLAVGGAIALFSYGDEELHPEVQALLQPLRPVADDENGYLVLWGLRAATGDPPRAVALQEIAAYEAAVAKQRDAGSVQWVEGYPEERLLPMSDALDSICRVEERPCLNDFIEQEDRISELLHEHRVMLGRYLSLYEYESFVSPATPSFDEPVPRFLAMNAMHALLHARIGIEYMSGNAERALGEVARDIDFQRHLLARSDSMILKMIAVNLLSRDLHLFTQMLDASGLEPHATRPVARALVDLNEAERSIAAPMRRELQAAARMYLNQVALAATLRESQDDAKPSWLVSVGISAAYKPRATVNLFYRTVYRPVVELSTLVGPPLLQRWAERAGLRTNGDDSGRWLQYLTSLPFNPVGEILVGVTRGAWDVYVARLHDLNGLLRLARLKARIVSEKIALADVPEFIREGSGEETDPYTGNPMTYDPEGRTIGFEALGVERAEDRWRAELPLYPPSALDRIIH